MTNTMVETKATERGREKGRGEAPDVPALLAPLTVDVAVSARQAARMYGSTVKELVAAGGVSRRVQVQRWASRDVPMRRETFVAVDRKALGASAAQLRHLAGTAAIRKAIAAPIEAWTSRAQARGATYRPDAWWNSALGEVAIEYDSGGYSRETVSAKARAFSSFEGGQVWGVPTELRRAYVRRLLDEHAENRFMVVLAQW